ncbi:MAG: hypothetical protein R3185_08925, partial [Candidatus Thermoplasmatota archaeon]|nr:hypothetical protein [Candidatus Thermoplasmatota archaeon]
MTTLIFATNPELYPELVAAGKQLGDDVVALALGPVAESTDGLAPGASKVLTATGDGLDTFLSKPTAHAITQVAENVGAKYVLVGGNRRGKEIAPRVAARLEAAYTVLAVGIEDGHFKRKYM